MWTTAILLSTCVVVTHTSPVDCVYAVSTSTPEIAYSYNLSAFRGLNLVGRDTAQEPSGTFNVSLCGNLTEPCKDSLTGKSNHKCVPLVCSFASSPSLPPSLSLSLSYNCHSKNNKNKMIGQEQPPGTVYTLFYRENKEAPGTCWDVLARWEHFVSATALATTGGDGKNGVLISFSRSGDAHISCNNVTVEVDISCDKLAPAEPKKALVTGVQTNCDWALKVRTAHSSICRPLLKIAIN